MKQVRHKIRGQVDVRQGSNQVRSQVWKQVQNQVWDRAENQVWDQVMIQVIKQIIK